MSPTSSEPTFDVYTDGGADPNPGPGGWGAVIIDQRSGRTRELSGGEARTTNNRMELTAAIRVLEELPPEAGVALHTDSIYLKKGITEWLPRWVARGWRRRTGKLQNEDLWRRLAELVAERRVSWHWVKGHAGHRHNERADELATAGIRSRSAKRPARPAADLQVLLRVSGGNGGGGWAALVREGGDERLITGAADGVSANELDLVAAAQVLESLPAGTSVALHTASDYLRNGATKWLAGWRAKGWTTKAGTPVRNRRAWERLAAVLSGRTVVWPSVKQETPRGWKELGRAARQAAGEGR